ncbi:hypothetical protein [Halorubellus litoreus]|uniref:Tat (Twin-arginine translocation) pathway signal sequence n=1 Tax=Halorubellus litoreus TaxID=755308 RepID=A0ABD5V7A1_9EURY
MHRRDVLKAVAGTSVITSVASTATAERSDGPSTDVRYRGTRIFEYEPERDGVAYTEKFRSKELRSTVGRTVVTIDRGVVAERELPERYRDRTSAFSVEFEDVAYLATIETFAEKEADIKRQAKSSSEPTVSSIDTVPLYSYSDTSTDLSERTGPISVIWDTFRDADQIQYEMQNLDVWSGKCWCSALPSKDRYVILDDGSTPAQHAGFAKGTGYLGAQWHARLWDLPDGRVVAQPHYDTADHCQIALECDFRFDETRDKVVDSFTSNVGDYSADMQWAGNGDGYTDDESADGWAKIITRN